jgi:hypothetical protein
MAPGRGSGNRLDPEPGFIEQPVEHAPGEGAMRSTALQGEIDQHRFPLRRALLCHHQFPLAATIAALHNR